MKVPYNESTRPIYETIARIAREIAAREEAERHEARKTRKVKGAA